MQNLNPNKTYHIHGLFHHAVRIWSQIIDDIVNNFYVFKSDIINEAKKQIKFYKTKQKITSVHFRRTDYVNIGAALSLDYYKKMISYYDVNDTFFVFSDDIPWCKSIKQEIFNNRNVIFIENNKQALDMCIMSLCDNMLLSNSTFSIWSAALNKNKEAKIISPQFSPGGCDMSLCFKNWLFNV